MAHALPLYAVHPYFTGIHLPHQKGPLLPPNNSPLDYLAAFAFAFMAGALLTLGLSQYIRDLQRQARTDSPYPASHPHPSTSTPIPPNYSQGDP